MSRCVFEGSRRWGLSVGILWALWLTATAAVAAEPGRLELQPHDHVVIVGNTLAERMQYFGNFETLLHARFPQQEIFVRDLGWSADELTIRLRSQGFRDHGSNLVDHSPDVVIAMFGFNESFAGSAGVAKFEKELAAFVKDPFSIDRFTSSANPSHGASIFSRCDASPRKIADSDANAIALTSRGPVSAMAIASTA